MANGETPYFSAPNKCHTIIANGGGSTYTVTFTIHKPTAYSNYSKMHHLVISAWDSTVGLAQGGSSGWLTRGVFNNGFYNTGSWSGTAKSFTLTIPVNKCYTIKIEEWGYITTGGLQVDYPAASQGMSDNDNSSNAGNGLVYLKIHNVKAFTAPSIVIPAAANKTTYRNTPYVRMKIPAGGASAPGGFPIETFEVQACYEGTTSLAPSEVGTMYTTTSARRFATGIRMEKHTTELTYDKQLNSIQTLIDNGVSGESTTNFSIVGVGASDSSIVTPYVRLVQGDVTNSGTGLTFGASNWSSWASRAFKKASLPATKSAGDKITAANWNTLNTVATNHHQWCKNADGSSAAVTQYAPISKASVNTLNGKIWDANFVFVSGSKTTVTTGTIISAADHYNANRNAIDDC